MSYETSQADEAAAAQRTEDTGRYTTLENSVDALVAQVQAWHTDAQQLATESTQNPGDTTDLNTMRANFQAQVDAILAVAFT